MPNPASNALSIALPAGGKLVASPGVPRQSAECSAVTNLESQIAPWLASVSCQLVILKLLRPLIEIVSGLPTPSARAIQEFVKISQELMPCLLAPTPAGVLPFVRELLCLEVRSLTCLRHNLEVMATLVAAGPGAVSAVEVQSVLDSYEPIAGMLDLAGNTFGIAGVTVPQAPALAAGIDLAALKSDQQIVATFIAALQTAVDALGGC